MALVITLQSIPIAEIPECLSLVLGGAGTILARRVREYLIALVESREWLCGGEVTLCYRYFHD